MPAPVQPPEPRLAYRVREIVELTGWSRALVYRWTDSGQLPAVRVGRSVRVMHDDLVAFMEAHRSTGVDR